MIEYHIECQTITPDEVIDFVSSLAPPVEDHIATAPTLQASSTVRSSSLQPTSTQTSAQSSTSFSETFTPINTAPGLSLHTCPAHLHEGLAVSHDPVQSIAKDSTHALLSSTGITPSCSADTLTPERDEIEHDDHGGDQSVEDEFSDPGVIPSRTETWDADQSIEEDAMETETETETMDGDDSAGDDLSDEDFDMTQVETTEGDTSDGELSDDDSEEMDTDSKDDSYYPETANTLSTSRLKRAPSPPSWKPKKPQKTRKESDLENTLDDDEDNEYEKPDDTDDVDSRLKGAEILDSVVPIEDAEFLRQLQEAQGGNLADKMDVRAEGTPPPEPEYTFNPDDALGEMIRKAV